MSRRLSNVSLAGLLAMLACMLALASVLVERVGPEMGQYGNLCGPSGSAPCLEPVLNGGFPLAFLFDTPGASVERKLSFGEDTLRPGALVLDIALNFVALLLLTFFLSRLRPARK
jgi:hypothetical protein